MLYAKETTKFLCQLHDFCKSCVTQSFFILHRGFTESTCNQLQARMLHLQEKGIVLDSMERTMPSALGTQASDGIA